MKRFAITLAAIVAVNQVPALAQSETGTRMGGRPAQLPTNGSDADRARIWLERYANCVYRRDPKRVEQVLHAQIGDTGPIDRLTQGNFDACLSTRGGADRLEMSNRVFRGALYADRVTSLAGKLARELPVAGAIAYPAASTLDAEALTQAGLIRFGECVVQANPAAALGFVKARAVSAGERKNLALLQPSLGNCILVGQQIRLSPSVLEAALAEAIYRKARAASAPGAG